MNVETKEELEQLMSEIKSLAHKVRNKLKLIQRNIEENDKNTSAANIRIQQTQVLSASNYNICPLLKFQCFSSCTVL